jgi:hypothetical protein
MAVSPHDPVVVYYGSQYLHRSRDKGVTWERISPDLTARPECCQGASGEPITRDITGEEFYSTLYAIAESPHERGVIWVGANDGPFHLTRDNGKTWTDITPKDLPPGGRVQYIEPSPHRSSSAYYAVYRYLLGDFEPYIYRTDDYGKTWTRLTDGRNGIPADTPTRVVREDPAREGLLYAGTEFGLFVSFDNGAHWQPFQLNLPNVPVTDIKLHHGDLIVSTQGRGFWILDGVTALHQITPQTSLTEAHLYRPRDGYRTRTAPTALGPTLDYYLPDGVAGPVTIDILDAQGAVVNKYDSDTAVASGGRRGAGGDQDDPDVPARFRRPPAPKVTKNAGLNRFVWDVRNEAGVTVPPGRYQARLTAGGATHTEPFTVLIDPAVAKDGVTEADLREQFDHNMRMRDLVTRANDAVARVRDLQAKQSASEAGADRAKRVASIADVLLTQPVRYGKPGLQAHILYLAGMTANVDQKIGRDALERYTTLKKELDDVVMQLDALQKGTQ